MKNNFCYLALLSIFVLGGSLGYGQDSMGPGPKRARTSEDYKPRTLKEITEEVSEAEQDRGSGVIVRGDIIPTRARVIYEGRRRPLPKSSKAVLNRWAQLYAGAPGHYTKPYETELLFKEGRRKYWLAVGTPSLARFKSQIKKGNAVDLFVIRLGGAKNAETWTPLILVENFQKTKVGE